MTHIQSDKHGSSRGGASGGPLFTSESVTEGHPDKLADQISDAVLDAILKDDPEARVACETLVAKGFALVAGEIKGTKHADLEEHVDLEEVVRRTIIDAGYDRAEDGYGIDGKTCEVLQRLGKQSCEIANRVNFGGAGDQGMMFGYACEDTREFMPAPIATAHALVRRLAEARKSRELSWLRPDGKAQATFEYDCDYRPVRVTDIVVSAQHDECVSNDEIDHEIKTKVIEPAVDPNFYDSESVRFFINPSGSFVKGGPHADAGLTGRKIIVDTYGGMGRHGGGAFSGKDATKVDRSGAYAARWAAKNLVAARAARRCEVQLAYAIGEPDPVQIYVDSFGTSRFSNSELSKAVEKVFCFRPACIIDRLGLRKPIFFRTAAYGHFGREPKKVTDPAGNGSVEYFAWERTDRTDDLKEALKL